MRKFLKVEIIEEATPMELVKALCEADPIEWDRFEDWKNPPVCDEADCLKTADWGYMVVNYASEGGIPYWFCMEHIEKRVIIEED